MASFCASNVKRYEQVAQDKSDAELDQMLFEIYPTLNVSQSKDPMYRKWRRCVIVEMLKRGLITHDPGPNNPPERR